MKAKLKAGINQIFQRLGYQISRIGTAAIDVFTLQSQLIKAEKPVIFDLGAHVGGVTKVYLEQFPHASIYCFEPFPEAFQRLSNNTKDDVGVRCFETAVSEAQGTAVFNSNLSAATNSLLPTDERGASFWGEGLLQTSSQFEVNTTTLDAFCSEQDIAHIDILKIDVQGAEFSVLKGAGGMLKKQQISLIYTELIMCPTYKGQHKLHEYLSYLDSLGYEFLDFFNQVRSQNQLIQADVVFLSTEYKKSIQN